MTQSFGNWRIWEGAPAFTAASLEETLDGGQAFRWNRCEDYYEGRWGSQVVRLRSAGEGSTLEYSLPPSVDAAVIESALNDYFATSVNFAALTDQLPWRSDPILATSIQAFPGLRILRQPFGECLFSFLCSSTKQIPQIKAIHENVARSMGNPLPDGSYGLPDWEQIAEAGEAPLRAAKLGYRARYIHQTAVHIAQRPGWLRHIEQATTTEAARGELMQLPGVGRKIADCVLLFGAGRYDAFPIDTWVEKILCKAYQLESWSLPQLQQFARIHFGPLAGYAQQYLFAAARSGLIYAR